MNVIPIKAQAGIIGFESPAKAYEQSSLSLDELLIDHPSATYFASVEGDSMTSAGIFPNDILVVSRAADVKNMSIIVANLNGVFVCKHLDVENRSLVSANDMFTPHLISEGDEFQVEGVVISSIRLHTPLNKRL
jgi:DNA polymerase V